MDYALSQPQFELHKLDSLCNTSANWTKDGNNYIYKVTFFE